MIRFGPAGNSDSFNSLKKHSVDVPEWLHAMGLDAYEYQCGRGVNISEKTAKLLGERARTYGIALSLHSPYYISLANPDPERLSANIDYILKSCEAATNMGADRVIVHSGSLGGKPRAEALSYAARGITEVLKAVRDKGYTTTLCLETMGKINQLGTLSEVLELCSLDEGLLPCVDFGHLYARTLGEASTTEAYQQMLDEIVSKLGFDRAKHVHIHFSQIEFSKGGEVRHLNLDNGEFGPPFAPLAKLLSSGGFEPRIICESAGRQAEDALAMKKIYEAQAAALGFIQ